MNRYSLDSNSRRWWWPSAAAGALGAVAVATVFVLGATGAQAGPVETPRQEPAGGYPGPVSNTEHPCFIVQPRWNRALDWEQPTCPLPVPVTATPRTVIRPDLDYLP